MTAQPDIFLSYNREDQAVAKLYADAFAAEGLNVWWDTALRSGEAYDEVTEAALRAAKAVVVLWSPRSVVSRWVRAEATIADRCKTLVPVTIEPCERPIMFELTQTADLTHWTGDAGDRAWLAFLGDVRRFVGRKPIAADTAASKPQDVRASSANGGRPVLAIPAFKGSFESEFGEDLGHELADAIVAALSRYNYLLRIQTHASAAEYVLEGTLRRSGEQVFLSARLHDVRESTPIWAERLEVAAIEVPDSPENFANKLVAKIATVIEATETRRAAGQAVEEATPYQLLLGALHAVRGFSRDSMDQASAMLERALEKVPDDPYVLALSSLTCGLKVAFQWTDNSIETAQLAQNHMRRALQRGGDDPQVLGWAAVGGVNSGGEIATLDAMIDRAVVRNPGWFYLWHFSGQTKLCRGNLADAISHFENSLRLEPWSPDRWAVLAGLGMAHVLAGNFEIGLPSLLEAEQLLPGNPVTIFGLVAAYVHLGRIEDARSVRERLAHTIVDESFDYYREPAHQAFLRDAWSKAS